MATPDGKKPKEEEEEEEFANTDRQTDLRRIIV